MFPEPSVLSLSDAALEQNPDWAGFSCRTERIKVGEPFRRILSIAMDQRDEVEAILDGVPQADLLVAPVTLIDGIEQDRQGKGKEPDPPDLLALLKRPIA